MERIAARNLKVGMVVVNAKGTRLEITYISHNGRKLRFEFTPVDAEYRYLSAEFGHAKILNVESCKLCRNYPTAKESWCDCKNR
jgi:hypothetical protein